MKAVLCLSALVLGALSVPADTLQLRDGRVINGTFEGGDRAGIRFRAYNEDRGRFFDMGRVSNLSFDNNGSSYNSSYNRSTYNSSSSYGSADRTRDRGYRDQNYRDQYGDQTSN